MKINALWLLPTALLAGLLGVFVASFGRSMQSSQQGALAGQTLADLSRELERFKCSHGCFPESLDGISVQSTSGDFSREAYSRIEYRRTEDGFVAFVGVPGVVFVENGKAPDLKLR